MQVKEVRDMEKDKGGFSPHLKMLKNSALKAMNQGVGIWSKVSFDTDFVFSCDSFITWITTT